MDYLQFDNIAGFYRPSRCRAINIPRDLIEEINRTEGINKKQVMTENEFLNEVVVLIRNRRIPKFVDLVRNYALYFNRNIFLVVDLMIRVNKYGQDRSMSYLFKKGKDLQNDLVMTSFLLVLTRLYDDAFPVGREFWAYAAYTFRKCHLTPERMNKLMDNTILSNGNTMRIFMKIFHRMFESGKTKTFEAVLDIIQENPNRYLRFINVQEFWEDNEKRHLEQWFIKASPHSSSAKPKFDRLVNQFNQNRRIERRRDGNNARRREREDTERQRKEQMKKDEVFVRRLQHQYTDRSSKPTTNQKNVITRPPKVESNKRKRDESRNSANIFVIELTKSESESESDQEEYRRA